MAATCSHNLPLPRRVAFVGSFDPFHDGHKNIVERALTLFDEVVIGVSINEDKHYETPLSLRVAQVANIYRDEPRVHVLANDGLTITFARQHHACCIIKGVRDAADFRDEQRQALWNKAHGNIETLLLVADEEYATLHSSALRGDNNK